MGTIDELFTALLFGSGAWFGLLLIIAVCLVVAVAVRYSGVFFTLLLIFLGYQYLTHISNADYLNLWFMFITWGASALCFGIFYGDYSAKKK